MKRCPKCGQTLDSDRFYRQRAQPDGLAPYCKACWKVDCSQRHAKKRIGMIDKRRIYMTAVRHDYFSVIERPIQAYVLGLLASDGNVSATRPRIAIAVLEEDRYIVETVRDELAPQSPITISRNHLRTNDLVKVTLTSPKMCSDLAKLGVVPRKSHILEWPTLLPLHLANSFLLGIYDGDGWITEDKRKSTPYFTAGIMSASSDFLLTAADVVAYATGLEPPTLGAVNYRAFTLRYGGSKAEFFLRWLHEDLPGLARKRYPSFPTIVTPATAAP